MNEFSAARACQRCRPLDCISRLFDMREERETVEFPIARAALWFSSSIAIHSKVASSTLLSICLYLICAADFEDDKPEE